MGLLDKAKSQAQELKGKVEGKVEDVQQKRKVSDLLERLGRLTYAQRTGRVVSDAEADRLVAELKELEDHGAEVASSTSSAS
jgi:CRISPR/Cas system type I-B associated protein Csh2 (Cas7 group RAMP superfamily)